MPSAASRPVSASLQEYARGVGGGLLFSLPLLYTMEVWWAGHTASPVRLLALVAGTFILLVAYNVVVGLREGEELGENVFESVEELGLGLLVAAGLLALVGQLPLGGSVGEWMGKVVVEGMIAAVGVSVGTAQLGERPGGGNGGESAPHGSLGEVALSFLGAVVVAANVAPTEEIVMIAQEASPGALLGLAGLSLALAALLLNFGAFRGSGRLSGSSIGPLRGTAVTYAAALVAATAMLWAFGQFDGAGLQSALDRVVVLGLPATLGAAAGRLLLQGGS